MVEEETVTAKDIYRGGSDFSTNQMASMDFSRITIENTPTGKKIKITRLKHLLDTLKDSVGNPKETIINAVSNAMGIEEIIAKTAELIAGSLTLATIALTVGKSMVKEITDLDFAAVLMSLINTEHPDFGLDKETILEDANLLLKKEKNYTIEEDKLNYILGDLEDVYKCIENIDDKWYLTEKVYLRG